MTTPILINLSLKTFENIVEKGQKCSWPAFSALPSFQLLQRQQFFELHQLNQFHLTKSQFANTFNYDGSNILFPTKFNLYQSAIPDRSKLKAIADNNLTLS